MFPLTQEQHRQNVERMFESKGILPGLPEGPIVPRFHAQQLAAAIEHELNRADFMGLTRVSISMDLIDAAELMKFLRKGSSHGDPNTGQ